MIKVSGVTIVRNAIKYDYPVVESIRSIIALTDEFIVAVGKSDDGTRELIESIGNPKIRIIDTVWDDSLREGGQVLAVETNKALDAVAPDSTWVFYIQADEVLHEKYHDRLRIDFDKFHAKPGIEGMLLNYHHFYGSYDYIGDSRRWYRREVRVVRNDKSIRSYKDAQGFRKNGKPLLVMPVEAWIYHYGWVKPPEKQQEKLSYFHSLWHSDEWIKKNVAASKEFDYSQIDSLEKFTGSHPVTMRKRIEQKNWQFSFDPTKRKFPIIKRILHFFEKRTGWRIGEYKNFKVRKFMNVP
jgi:glycosyltransferase involved in cell wall biosynthesis